MEIGDLFAADRFMFTGISCSPGNPQARKSESDNKSDWAPVSAIAVTSAWTFAVVGTSVYLDWVEVSSAMIMGTVGWSRKRALFHSPLLKIWWSRAIGTHFWQLVWFLVDLIGAIWEIGLPNAIVCTEAESLCGVTLFFRRRRALKQSIHILLVLCSSHERLLCMCDMSPYILGMMQFLTCQPLKAQWSWCYLAPFAYGTSKQQISLMVIVSHFVLSPCSPQC